MAKKAIGDSRKKIAELIGARPEEIIFTAGGTESDNLAIFGAAWGLGKLASLKDGHQGKSYEKAGARLSNIITSKFEHHAVLNACKFLEKHGFRVTYLDVGKEGIVNPQDVKKALKPETILVSVMLANN